MHKIKAYGIHGNLFDWINDFLSYRTQFVTVNGTVSQEGRVTSGIPQGSVLGPLLFIMYINDLPLHVENSVRIFADDTKIFAQSDTLENRQALQRDLDRLQQWSSEWLLKFHPDKCKVLRVGQNGESQQYFLGSETDGTRQPLENTQSEKDLGVIIDSKLNFKEHVAYITSKANRILGVIRRSFDHLTDSMFIQLYKTLVRPILEYGHSVWDPTQKTLKREIEDVQRRATKLISKLKDRPYEERLSSLKLPSLQHRRRRGDMIDLFKYVTGRYDTCRPKFEPTLSKNTRGSSKKLQKQTARLDVRKNFFSQRVILEWNKLPEEVVAAPSVNCFKNRLDHHWANDPSIYSPNCYN